MTGPFFGVGGEFCDRPFFGRGLEFCDRAFFRDGVASFVTGLFWGWGVL